MSIELPKIERWIPALLALALLAGCHHDEHDHDAHSHDGHDHAEHSHADHSHDEHDHDEHSHDEHDHDGHSHGDGDSWAVTAWGKHYEVFPEVGSLVVGHSTLAHTHVTRLADFSGLAEGSVEVVLVGTAGEETLVADRPVRAGVFDVEITPKSVGDFDLLFRIRGDDTEEIRGGRVRVGTAEAPGRLLVAPAPKAGSDGGDPVELLKEQQWRDTFATAWVRRGELSRSVSGLARVTPPAGGEALITAPVDGVLYPAGSKRWPFVGQDFDRGQPLLRVVPRVAIDRSLSDLEAEVTALDAEQTTAEGRLARLEELIALGATSLREVDEARARVATLGARHGAARADLEAARSTRQGDAAEGLVLRAPFPGAVASIDASPGATVAAGDGLARLLRTDRQWLQVALAPGDLRALREASPVDGVVLTDGENPPLRIDHDLKLVSIAPELSSRTGTVDVFLDIPAAPDLPLGATVDAQILLAERRPGIVVPASAVIDDGGVPVVYLQLTGEGFQRQEVRVLERQGDRVLVDRLVPGQRLVTRGGNSIRRASLMATGGGGHGHVH